MQAQYCTGVSLFLVATDFAIILHFCLLTPIHTACVKLKEALILA
jgi:hypothetical protein